MDLFRFSLFIIKIQQKEYRHAIENDLGAEGVSEVGGGEEYKTKTFVRS